MVEPSFTGTPHMRTTTYPLMLPVIGLRLLHGRVGSTALMMLLSSAPSIGLDRKYPYGEYRYLGYCVRAASYFTRPIEPGDPDISELLFGGSGRFGPLPFSPQILDRSELEPLVLAHLWSAFSESITAHVSEVRLYAEKLASPVGRVIDAGIPLRVVDCLRDPRDILASIRAFSSSINTMGFGQIAGENDDQYLVRFIDVVSACLNEMAATPSTVSRIVVRYEDFVSDTSRCAERLGNWIGVDLDSEVINRPEDELRRHMTSPSPKASIGRWRSDLRPGEADRIWEALGELLAPYGYREDGVLSTT